MESDINCIILGASDLASTKCTNPTKPTMGSFVE
jgi:hypothetical protein